MVRLLESGSFRDRGSQVEIVVGKRPPELQVLSIPNFNKRRLKYFFWIGGVIHLIYN